MKIEWIYNEENNCHLKTFLKQKGVSRRLSAKIRHEGGQLLVNNTSGRIVDQIKKGDKITIILPPEHPRKEAVIPSYVPLDIGSWVITNYGVTSRPLFILQPD